MLLNAMFREQFLSGGPSSKIMNLISFCDQVKLVQVKPASHEALNLMGESCDLFFSLLFSTMKIAGVMSALQLVPFSINLQMLPPL